MTIFNFSKATSLVLIICFLASCSVPSDPKVIKETTQPNEAGFSSDRLALIDTLLAQYVKNGVMPNAVNYVYRHGKLVHNKAYGWKNIENKEPVELNSIFRIASQTKALTSVGLMMLYEKGKFLLDDPVSKYIKQFIE